MCWRCLRSEPFLFIGAAVILALSLTPMNTSRHVTCSTFMPFMKNNRFGSFLQCDKYACQYSRYIGGKIHAHIASYHVW